MWSLHIRIPFHPIVRPGKQLWERSPIIFYSLSTNTTSCQIRDTMCFNTRDGKTSNTQKGSKIPENGGRENPAVADLDAFMAATTPREQRTQATNNPSQGALAGTGSWTRDNQKARQNEGSRQ